ncbi:hypothetical protein [Halonotius sp. GCM10025705]|uniref:hypothetical protein n=1 Tax=Halonotius sp. GCM10025705 TaxID=3252678 RepID=UPI0036164C75
MVSTAVISLSVSAFAIVLSLIAISRQSIPSKYEAERRIREKFQTPNGELKFEYNDVNYHINYITVLRQDGINHRIKELVFRDISGETQVVFTVDSRVPNPVDVKNISRIDEEGVRAIMFRMDTTEPHELYNQFSESAFQLSKEIQSKW